MKIFLKIKEKINFSVENTREYQEVEPQSMEVDSETAPAIEALIQKYPEYMKVEDLPIEQLDTKMNLPRSEASFSLNTKLADGSMALLLDIGSVVNLMSRKGHIVNPLLHTQQVTNQERRNVIHR